MTMTNSCIIAVAEELASQKEAFATLIGTSGEKEYWSHRLECEDNDKEENVFRWHFPRNLLRERMSAYELAEFLMPHLPAVVPFMADFPDIQRELQVMLVRFLTFPKAVLDEISPWIRVLPATEEDAIIEMSIGNKLATPAGPTIFVP